MLEKEGEKIAIPYWKHSKAVSIRSAPVLIKSGAELIKTAGD
jgi:hypothetical protein